MTVKRDNPDGRRARWDAHRAARRTELIGAAVAVVRAHGADVGMDDIARHAGIAKPIFYRYFADKADLHRAVGRSVAEGVVRQVGKALDQEASPRARLMAAIDSYLRSVEADPEVYRFVVHTIPPSRTPSADPFDDFATVVGLQATRVLSTLLREDQRDTGAAEPWGFGLVGMVRAAADRWLQHPSMTREALVSYLADLVVPGLLVGAEGQAAKKPSSRSN